MFITSQIQSLLSSPMYILMEGRFGLQHFALYEPVCCQSHYRPNIVAIDGDGSGLINALSGGNLGLTEASIWRISAYTDRCKDRR